MWQNHKHPPDLRGPRRLKRMSFSCYVPTAGCRGLLCAFNRVCVCHVCFAVLLKSWEEKKRGEHPSSLELKTSAWNCVTEGSSRGTESALGGRAGHRGQGREGDTCSLGSSEICRGAGRLSERVEFLEMLEFLSESWHCSPQGGFLLPQGNFSSILKGFELIGSSPPRLSRIISFT